MTTTQSLSSIGSLLCLCSFCRLIEATHTGHCLHLHIPSILHTAQCTLHTKNCTIHIAHCTIRSTHCTLYTAYCAMHIVHCRSLLHLIVEFDLLFVRGSQVAFTACSFISTSEVRASMNNTMTGGQQ